MLKVSDAFNSAFAAPDRELRARVTIGKTVYDSDDLTSINYDSGAMTGEQFSIGSTYMNSAKIIFSHLVEGLKQLDEVLVEFGVLKPDGTVEYVKMGTFIVDDKIQMDRNNNTTTIECMDRMTMLGGTYVSKLTYPARIKDVAIEIANMAGVKANETSFARLSENKINQPTGYTYRDAIGLIAQFQMGFALFDRDGLLDIRTLQDNSFKIDPNQYFLKGLVKNETFFKLNGISCTVVTTSKDENGNETSKTTVLQSGSSSGAQIKLANNVMTQDVLDRMYEALKFTNYYPFSLNWNGNPAVEAGDWLTVEDLQGNEFKVPNMSYTLTYNGGLTTTSKADTSVSSPATYSYGGSMSNIVNEIGGREGAEGNHIYEGTEDQKPLFPKEGDLWYKHVGPDTEEWIYKDGKWEFLTSTKTANDAADAADKASKEAEEAKKQANKAVDGANDAVAKAGFANDTANQAKSDAAAAGQQAKDALTSAGTAITDAQTAQSDAATAKIQATNAATQANQAVTDATTAKADANTAKINATQAINDAAAAKGQATNALGQAGTAIGNALTALNKVNNLSVGGRNLALGTSNKVVQANNWNMKVADIKYDKSLGRSLCASVMINNADHASELVRGSANIMINTLDKSGNVLATSNGNWVEYNANGLSWCSVSIDDNTVNIKAYILTNNMLQNAFYSCLKVEKGSVATDWTPAPEDVQQQFTNINGELASKVSQTTYNTLAGTVDMVSTLAKQNQSTIGTLATKTSVDTVNKTATTAQTLAQQNANELLNKASTNTVDTLTQRVTTAESTLSQTATKAELALTKTDVDKLNDTVKSQGVTLDATATKAELQVAQTNVDNLKKTVTSNTAGMTANANAIKLKADTTVLNELKGTVDKQGSEITLNTNSIKLKADQSSVDTLKGTVDKQGSAIDVNTKAIALKANQSTVDTLTGRVSTAEGKITVQADQISQTVSKTELTSKLNGYATQTWSEGKISATKNEILLGVETVKKTVNNMTVGGVNLLKNTTADVKTVSSWNNQYYKGLITDLDLSVGDPIIYSAFLDNTDAAITRGSSYVLLIFYDVDDQELTLFNGNEIDHGKSGTSSAFARIPAHAVTLGLLEVTNNQERNTAAGKRMLERGTLVTDWQPAPEDLASEVQFSQLQLTVNGIQGTVQNKADQSQVTQLAGQITSVVGDVSANSSQITQMKADINLRVQKSDVVNQINISPEGILIDGQKVHITGQTSIDNAVIKDAMIADIKADKITAGTLNAANVNVINLNANNITTGTIKGANLSMNLNTGEILFQKGSIRSTNGNLNINIDDGSMSLTNSQGEGAYFIDGKIAMTKNDIWTNGAIHYGQLTFGNNIFGNALGSVSGVLLEGAGGVIVGNKEFNPLTLFGPGKTYPSGGGIAANNSFATVASNGWASIEGGTSYAVPFSTNNPSIVAGISGKYSAPGAWMPTSDKGAASFVKGKLVGLYAEDGGFSNDHGTTADLAAVVDGRSGYILSAATYARTYASGAQMTITANGVFGRISSASKYKLAIGEISTLNDEAHQFLSVKPKQWFDKSESEALADTMTTGNTDYIDDVKALPHTGFIAEDLYTAGLDSYVIRGNDGSIESIQYDRLPVLHHELIRELFNRLDAAEMEIYKLKQEVINNAN